MFNAKLLIAVTGAVAAFAAGFINAGLTPIS